MKNKIISCIYLLYDDTNYYIGKTQNLTNRLNTHRSIQNTSMSRNLKEDFKHIILYETEDLNQLNKLEQLVYDKCKLKYGDNLLNKSRPMNTGKDYYNQHKKEILIKFKLYRDSHKDYFQDYYKSNIQNSKTCDACNIKLSKYRYDKHINTKKHINNITNMNNINNNLTSI